MSNEEKTLLQTLLTKLSATETISELSVEEKNLLQTLLENSSKLAGTGVAANSGTDAKGLVAAADKTKEAKEAKEKAAAADKVREADKAREVKEKVEKAEKAAADRTGQQPQVQELEGNSFNGGGIIIAAIAAAVGLSLLL